MAVLPPLTDDFVINGGFAAMTFFSIILTIYLIRYRFRICREERRTWVQAHPCRLRGTGCQSLSAPSPCASSRVLAALGHLCLVIMLAAAGVMCGTRGSALAQTGTAWNSSVAPLPNAAGEYYLTEDVISNNIWIVPSGGVTLDLNGHNVTGYRFSINSGVTLTVKNSGNSGEITFQTWPIEVNGGSFYFEGGTLTTSGNNSIVEVIDNGNFSMSGGTITGGNRGVNLQNKSHFAMTGGKIINNDSYGVVIAENSTAEISGGEISGHGYDGIRAVSGRVIMSGGVIKGNQNGILIGDRNNSGTLNLSGGSITENSYYGIYYQNGELNLSDAPAAGAPHPTVTGNGSNVYIANDVNDLRINVTGSLSQSAKIGISMAKPGVFTNGLNNRGTSANFSSDKSSYDVCLTAAGEAKLGRAVASITSGGVTNKYASLQDAMDAAQPNDTILLLDNISASTDTFPILAWREDITLDLNGKTISGRPASSSGDLIQIGQKNVGGENHYGRLTLKDTAGSGEIVCEDNGCENVINIMGGEPNVLTMNRGKISGGTTNVKNTGKFVMNGGEISGGTTNVNSSGQFVMSGGKISGGTTGVICHTICSMSGGEISGASGNGVTLDDTSPVFNLLGGTITGNGQYAIEAFANSIVFISNGNPIIVSRGSAESSRGIYLNVGSGITIYDTPAAGSSIGVTLKSGAGVAARGRSKAPTEDDLAVFHSDEGYAKFLKTAEKTIVFGYQISYDAGGAEGDLPDALNLDPTDTTADPKVPDRGSLTKRGYRFTGWKDEADNEYMADADFKTLIATYKPSGSVKLTAQWEATSVRIRKVDDEGHGLPGAVFRLKETQSGTQFGQDLTTDTNGEGLFTGVTVGVDYTLQEVTPPAAYYYALSQDITFVLNNENKITITAEGMESVLEDNNMIKVPNQKTRVSILKVDTKTGNALAGVQLKVMDANQSEKASWTSTDQAHVIEGLLNVGETYTVHEVSPLTGYAVAEDITFTIQSDGTIHTEAEKNAQNALLVKNVPVYTVSFAMKGHGTAVADIPDVVYNTTITEPAEPSETGWSFGGWYKEDTLTNAWDFAADKVTEDTTLYAKWTVNNHKVSYEVMGTIPAGAPSAPAETTADFGTEVTVAAGLTLEGYTFSGWTTGDAAVSDGKFTMPDGDVKFTGSWTINGHKVSYEVTGTIPAGAPGAPAETIADFGTEVTVAAGLTLEGYTFSGWTTGDAAVSDGKFTMPDGDVRFTGSWTINGHKVSYEVTGTIPAGAPGAPAETIADFGTEVTVAAGLTLEGYTFSGWTTGDAAVSDGKFTMPDADVKFTGSWTINGHKVSYEVTGTIPAGAPAAPAETTADFGTEVTVAAGLTLEGYTFSGWTTGDAAVSDGKFTMPDGDVKFTGSWTINTYTITWKNWDGTVLETDEDVPYGTTPSYDGVTPVRPADEEYTYTFTGWTPEIVKVTADAVYTAVYSNETILYTVKVIPGANMTKTADSGAEEQTVNKGSAIKAVVYTAAAGYYFPEDYSVDAVNGISVSRDSDKQITVSGLLTEDTEIKLKDAGKEPEVEAPVIDPKEGTYSEPQRVTISCATEGAVIYYTTDRSDPSVNSTKYEGPFTIDKTTTIKTVAVLNGKYFSIVVAEILTIEIPPESWKINVDIHNFSNTGAKGVPGDVPRTEFDLTVQIVDKESGEIVSTGADVKVAVMGGPNTAKISLKDVEFNRKVEDLSEAKYKVVVKGFPKKVTGVAPMSQVYSLSYSAWPGERNLITIYLKWDDGKRSEPERIKVYALPEDEIGAYTIDKNGVKEYLIFHTYDICMQWLGRDDLCSGHERCFHKENPYVNPFVKYGGLIGEIVN